MSTTLRCLLSALVFALPGRALAYNVEPAHTERPGPPNVLIAGEAVVRDARVVVRCDAGGVFERSATCTVRASFEVVAREAVRLEGSRGEDVIRVDGTILASGRALAAGSRARVEVSARRTLEASTRWRRGPWVLTPMVGRHPFLGDTEDLERRGDGAEVVLTGGRAVTYEGEVALDADGDGSVRCSLVRDARSSIAPGGDAAAPPTELVTGLGLAMGLPGRSNATTGFFQNGGPVLALGARIPLDDSARGRFLLRAAYEVAAAEYLFGTLSVETDFESLYESLVLDVASPELLVIVPSFRAGVGVVARQLGPRPPDFALRLRVGGNVLAMGGDVDFDYWPERSAWTLTATGRLSL